MMTKFRLYFVGIFTWMLLMTNVISASEITSGTDIKSWKTAKYTVSSSETSSFECIRYGNMFSGNDRSIIRLAEELNHLQGIRLKTDRDGQLLASSITLNFRSAVKLLVGIPTEFERLTEIEKKRALTMVFKHGNPSCAPLLRHAISITEMPQIDIYSISYPAGTYQIDIPARGLGDEHYPFVLAGVISQDQDCSFRDVNLPSGEDYPAFIIDGYSEQPALFTIIGGQDQPVIDEDDTGTEDIQGGFEGGSCIKIEGVYHAFPTERAGEKGKPAKYDRIKTRIGHWISNDAIHWQRISTLYQSSGVYAVSHEDNPANDRRAAIWSYMPIFSQEANRWYGHYLAYTADETITPNHSFGRIWRCESTVEGIEGIDGPYRDCGIAIEPGLDSRLWEGRQGVASFFPYRVKDKWLSFYSGAYPFEQKEDYPYRGKPTSWCVGLAESDHLEGPWTRMDSIANPITSIHPKFVENPIVSQLPDSTYIAVFDGGPDYLNLPNMIAYTTSKDGYHWSQAHYLPIDNKINKWWDIMRTPLCLISEGNDVYTIVFAAIIKEKRFHPMGMVRVKWIK